MTGEGRTQRATVGGGGSGGGAARGRASEQGGSTRPRGCSPRPQPFRSFCTPGVRSQAGLAPPDTSPPIPPSMRRHETLVGPLQAHVRRGRCSCAAPALLLWALLLVAAARSASAGPALHLHALAAELGAPPLAPAVGGHVATFPPEVLSQSVAHLGRSWRASALLRKLRGGQAVRVLVFGCGGRRPPAAPVAADTCGLARCDAATAATRPAPRQGQRDQPARWLHCVAAAELPELLRPVAGERARGARREGEGLGAPLRRLAPGASRSAPLLTGSDAGPHRDA